MIFTTKNNQLAIFGKTLDDVKNKLIDFDMRMSGARFGSNKSQIIPEENLIKVLSFDEASKQLEDFNRRVVQGGMSLDTYFKQYQNGNTVLRNYVTTTDQQSQSTQGLIRASEEARAAQIAHNEAIKAQTLSAKAGTVALKALSIAGNMILFAAITKVIELIVKGFDNWIHRVEKANEAMQDAVGEYESAKSSLENVNSELEEQNKQLDELLAKDKLTYAEQGQLEELQAITRELLLQQDIKERRAGKASKEAAEKAVDAYEKQYGKYDKTEDELKEKISREIFPDPENEDDVLGNIAAYIRATELLEQSQKDYQNAINSGEDTTWFVDGVQFYIDMVDDYSQVLDDNISDLQDKRAVLENEYNKAIEKRESGTEPLTTSEKEIIDTYESIYDVMRMVYEYTNQNAWNNMEISNIFNTEGIEKTKDELIAMARAGELTPETITSYENLNEAIQNSELFLKDGQTAAQAFCDEIYCCANATDKLAELGNEDPIPLSDIFSLKDADNNLTHLGKISESIDTIQNAYKTLNDAIDEYNEEGAFSIDTLQSVVALGDDWLDYLVDEEGNLKLNKEALEDLTRARLNDMRIQAINNVINNVSKIQDEAGANEYLASTNYALADSYEAVAKARLSDARASMAKAVEAGTLSQSSMDEALNKATADIDKINKLFDNTSVGDASIMGNFGGSGSGGSSAKSDFSETIDFFKERIEILNDALSHLKSTMDNISGSSAKNNLVDAELGITEEKFNNYTDALKMYTQKANEALSKLPADIAAKVKDGAVALTDFVGDGNKDVVEAIKDYQSWAGEISACKDELAKLGKEIRQLELEKFNNIMEDFQNQFDLRGDSKDLISKQIDLLKEAGELIGKSFFTAQINQSKKQLELLENEKAQLVNQMSSAISSGRVNCCPLLQ